MKKYRRIDLNARNKKPSLRKSIEVPGVLIQDHKGIKNGIIDVFTTCDEKGKTISFSHIIEGIMITVPVEAIEDLLKEVLAW